MNTGTFTPKIQEILSKVWGPLLTIETQKQYVRSIVLSEDQTICGLFLNHKLIASAGVQYNYSKAFIENTSLTDTCMATHGRFVLEKENRGKGYGKTLIWATVNYINKNIGTEWFGGKINKMNIASIKSDVSCGYDIMYEGNDNVKLAIHINKLKHPKKISNIVYRDISSLC